MKLKIALLIDSLNSGGAQRQIVNLALGLKSHGHEVVVITYNKGEHYRNLLSKQHIPYINIRSTSLLGRVWSIQTIIKQREINWLVAFLFTPSLVSLLAKLIRPNISVILSERTFEENVPPFHKYFTRNLYFLASSVTANSMGQTHELKLRGFNKSRFIRNSIDSVLCKKRISPINPSKILGIGRVSKLKNLHTLIEALGQLKVEGYHKFEVNWLGDFEEHRSYFESCQKKLIELGLSENWKWVGVTDRVVDFIDESGFLYHGSFGEGFPNAVLESLGRGLPVLISNVNDHSHIIKEGHNGFLFDPNSAQELKDKLLLIRELDDSIALELSENAYHTVSNNYSIKSVTSDYLSLMK